jgi:hypothetical protein
VADEAGPANDRREYLLASVARNIVQAEVDETIPRRLSGARLVALLPIQPIGAARSVFGRPAERSSEAQFVGVDALEIGTNEKKTPGPES